MLWAFTLIIVLAIVAVALDEPGRFRGVGTWPASAIEETPGEDEAEPGGLLAGVRTDRMTVSCWSNGIRRRWTCSYVAEDGDMYLFHFDEDDFPLAQREFREMCDDPELGWTGDDERFVRRGLLQAFYRILKSENAKQAESNHNPKH